MPIISFNHNSEMVWLPEFDVAFAFDSFPELHKDHIARAHCFLQHVACSTIELVPKTADSGIPHQPEEGNNANVCAFSASLFLQHALKLMNEHGSTAALVEKLRELTVDESEYHKYRMRAGEEIYVLVKEYGTKQRELRMAKRNAAKQQAGSPKPKRSKRATGHTADRAVVLDP